MAVGFQHVAVPAFFGVNNDWTRIENAGGTIRLVVADLTFNGLTGQGLIDARAQFQRCRAQCQLILGYVDTQFAQRTLNAINADIQQWFAAYPSELDGIFFDDGPYLENGTTDQTYQNFYSALIQNFKAAHPGHETVLLNASAFPNDWVMQDADYVILWEDNKDKYLDDMKFLVTNGPLQYGPPPAWWSDAAYTERIVHVNYNCTTAADLRLIMDKSRTATRNAGIVYVIEQPTANYPSLPTTYWDDEVALALGGVRLDHGNPWWLSPSVWAETSAGQPAPSPQVGQSYVVKARIRNVDTVTHTNVTVNFFWANPSLGITRTNATPLGNATVANIAASTTADVAGPNLWSPSFINQGHECLLAEIAPPAGPLPEVLDGLCDSHVAQNNLTVLAQPSPPRPFFHVPFEVHNTRDREVSFTINAQQARPDEVRTLLERIGIDRDVVGPLGAVDGLGVVDTPCPTQEECEEAALLPREAALGPKCATGFSLVGRPDGGTTLVHVTQEDDGQVVGGLSVLILASREPK